MSTEAQLTQRFLRRLRVRFPEAVVLKLNDRTTSGLPDACVTYQGRTIWLEFKRREAGDRRPYLEVVLSSQKRAQLQLTMLWRLNKASEGRAFVVMFECGLITLLSTVPDVRPALIPVYTGTTDQIIDHLMRSS